MGFCLVALKQEVGPRAQETWRKLLFLLIPRGFSVWVERYYL